ncbi:SbmA/BacA-like family transporter [Phreatobacter sp.]|uniref:ABC transporter ATP-binding protein/permease n=1 Tax=Phreatobacter sp. TaxID=1966341 RepID=UPI0022CB2851|nr:SbmA/BacA-like family transporter [Phreatobacter sp.]MCZ8316892.1 hypothetical protein [Phreatobacter sp.]
MLFNDLTALREQLAANAAVRARLASSPRPGRSSLRMLALIAGVARKPGRWRILALTVLVGTVTVVEVLVVLRLATWNADFFDVLEARSYASLHSQIWILAGLLLGMMTLQGLSLQTKMKLQMALRSHLTTLVRDRWMSEGHYYRLRSMAGDHTNEDARIAEDIRIVCEMAVEFAVSLLYALVQLVLFAGVLWLYSGPLTVSAGTISVTVPGHMVFVAIAYAIIASTLITVVGHPLVKATDLRQAAEAQYRSRLVNIVAQAPAIALTGSEAGERRRLARSFDAIRRAWAVQTASFRNLMFFSSGLALLTGTLPLLIMAPRYLNGAITLGTLMQVAIAFGQVTMALSWLSANYAMIAQWQASASRVLALGDAIDRLRVGEGASSGLVSRTIGDGPVLTFSALTIVGPSGDRLVNDLTTEVRQGERVLIEATPQASTALIGAIAGLPTDGAGAIVLPNDGDIFFLTDKPYLPEATLLEVIAEPLGPDDVSHDLVCRAPTDVGLVHLAAQVVTTSLWAQELGIEDQQRLGFARLLVHQPRWILTHDASSALSQETETLLFRKIREALPLSVLITMSHRTMAASIFTRRIALATTGDAPQP